METEAGYSFGFNSRNVIGINGETGSNDTPSKLSGEPYFWTIGFSN
jgi:hypothetical protein